MLVGGQAEGERPRVAARLRAVAEHAAPPAVVGGAAGRVRVSVYGVDAAERVRSAGFAARGVTREVAVVELAVEELERLAAVPGVISVEPLRRLRPTLDLSGPATGATALRAETGLDGSGVVVGVVDTGADFRHADLRHADGKTRIAALLDLAHGRGRLHPELPDYAGGALWLAADIDRQLEADRAHRRPVLPVTERDTSGHGTHVAGIAAGSGRAPVGEPGPGRYLGMAPGATLVVAQATRGGTSFFDGDVLAGVRFVLERARAQRMPVVVNLSLGDDTGPHDGSSNLERGLDALVPEDEPGLALVVSAGNKGARDHHAGGWLLDGEVEIGVLAPRAATEDTRAAIDLWTDAESTPPEITVLAPDGRRFGPVAAGERLDGGAEEPQGRVVIGNDAMRDPVNRRHEAFVDVGAGAGPMLAGTWRVVLAGRVRRWDGWMNEAPPGVPAPRFTSHLDPDTSGGMPAFARSAIAVGSYVTRARWRTVDGQEVSRAIVPGQPSAFSGTGPSSDGRFFPDLVAPGEFVISSLSAAATPDLPGSVFHVPGSPGLLWADDGLHGLLRGTSQAAPHVAGAIALLFQIDPRLTPRRLRELLRASATVEAGGPGYSPKVGFGRLDVRAAALLLRRVPVGPVDPRASTVGVSRDLAPPGAGVPPVRVSVVPRDAAGMPLGPGRRVVIESDLGRWAGEVADLGEGRYERLLDPAGASPGGAATIRVTVDGVALAAAPPVHFARDRREVGRPEEVGGCGVGGPAGRGQMCIILHTSVAVWFLLRRRRATRARADGSSAHGAPDEARARLALPPPLG